MRGCPPPLAELSLRPALECMSAWSGRTYASGYECVSIGQASVLHGQMQGDPDQKTRHCTTSCPSIARVSMIKAAVASPDIGRPGDVTTWDVHTCHNKHDRLEFAVLARMTVWYTSYSTLCHRDDKMVWAACHCTPSLKVKTWVPAMSNRCCEHGAMSSISRQTCWTSSRSTSAVDIGRCRAVLDIRCPT